MRDVPREGAEGTAGPQDDEFAAAHERVVALARAAGALGVYYDRARAEFVVVFPAGASAGWADFATVTPAVRVAASRLPAGTIERVTAALAGRAFHPAAGEYAYGIHIDLVRDVIVLGTNAPAEVVAPLRERFGDAIEVRVGPEPGRL